MANSHGRSIRRTEVAKLLKELGLSQENFQQLQEITEPRNREKQNRRAKTARAMTAAAFTVALAEWWYQLVTPEPNFIFGSFLLAGTVFFAALAAIEFMEPKQKAKITILMLALCLFGLSAHEYCFDKQFLAPYGNSY